MGRVPRTDEKILWSSKASQNHSMLCERKSQALGGSRKAKIMQSPQSEKHAHEEKKYIQLSLQGEWKIGVLGDPEY